MVKVFLKKNSKLNIPPFFRTLGMSRRFENFKFRYLHQDTNPKGQLSTTVQGELDENLLQVS